MKTAAQYEADQAVRDHVRAWFDPSLSTSFVSLLQSYRYAAERVAGQEAQQASDHL